MVGRGGKRPGAGRPKLGKDETTVRVPRDIGEQIAAVVEVRGCTVAEYLDRKLRAAVARDFARLAESTT